MRLRAQPTPSVDGSAARCDAATPMIDVDSDRGAPPTALAESTAGRANPLSIPFLVVIALAGLLMAVTIVTATTIAAAGDLGIDYVFYRDVGQRFLETGVYYLPHQLAGPYDVTLMLDVLYPPSALLLFVPLVWVPALLWWAIPIGVTLYIVRGWDPGPWAIAAMLALLLWPRAHGAFLYGNTDMWAMAGLAAGLRWGWPAILLTIKPTLAPFALVGIRHRSWWLAAALMGGFILLSLPLWLDYVTAIRNVAIGGDYSLGSIPLMLVPLAAWAGRRKSGALSS